MKTLALATLLFGPFYPPPSPPRHPAPRASNVTLMVAPQRERQLLRLVALNHEQRRAQWSIERHRKARGY